MEIVVSAHLASLLLLLAAACGGQGAPAGTPAPTPAFARDTTGLIPAGYGTLRQDDIAMRLTIRGAYAARVLPLDEGVIRLLAPDSYRAMHELKAGRGAQIAQSARRYGMRAPTLLYVSFFGIQPEARFNPQELVLTSVGREYRPVDIIPLTPSFGEQRIRQRETQNAIYLFEDGIDVLQPLTVTLEGVQSTSWAGTLRTLEQERTLVRARAARGKS